MAEAGEKPDWEQASEARQEDARAPEVEVVDEADVVDEVPDVEEKPADKALVPQDALSRYLAEIRRYPLLTREEEHKLAVRYREGGDVEAAYRLVTANLRLVVMIARRYENAFRNLFDLVQEGN